MQSLAQLQKVVTPCIDCHQIPEDDFDTARESAEVRTQVVLKCIYLARVGRPDILCTENIFASAVAKCFKRSTRLISDIHCTVNL